MERIWTRHWAPGVDEAAIRLPAEPLPVFLTRNAVRSAPGAAGVSVWHLHVTGMAPTGGATDAGGW